MKNILLTSVFALWTLVGYAEERIDFKGVALGSSEQELLKQHPEFKCNGAGKRPGGADRICLAIKDSGATYAGVSADINLLYYSDSLEYVLVYFSSDKYLDIHEALIAKYGAPTLEEKQQVTNRMGAVFEDVTSQWKRSGTILQLSKYVGKISTSNVTISTETGLDNTLKARKKSIENKSKDL